MKNKCKAKVTFPVYLRDEDMFVFEENKIYDVWFEQGTTLNYVSLNFLIDVPFCCKEFFEKFTLEC